MVRNLFFLGVFVSLVPACVAESSSLPDRESPEEVFSQILEKGLTCEVQASILGLEEVGLQQLLRLMRDADLTIEQRHALIEAQQQDCPSEGHRSLDAGVIGSQTQAITGTYAVVFIPESTTGGNYGSSVFRDSSSSSWMCNNGASESPADYIMQFHLQGAYYSRNSLKLQGQNVWGSCYLGSTTASRVYSDDDIRSCIGWWTVFACGGTPPLTTDIKIGL